MVVIDDRRGHAVNGANGQPQMSSARMSSPRPWVAPTWERRDTPMEVTMYAGQR